MKKITVVTTVLLFFLVFVRVNVRSESPLWIDEVEQIQNLRSVNHLIYEYLPNIPAGWPGHYLLTLPIQKLYPYNKFILGLPGLLSHVGVFLLFPKVLARLFTLDKRRHVAAVLTSRVLFTIDPYLTFQSMEVRPYAVLPFVWVLCVLLSVTLVREKWNTRTTIARFVLVIVYIVLYLLLFIWHAYGFIMSVSIILFLLIQNLRKKESIPWLNTSIVFFFSCSLVIPIWLYFSKGSSQFAFPPFEMFPSVGEIISGKRGIMVVYGWQQILFLLSTATVAGVIFFTVTRAYIRQNKRKLFDRVIFPLLTLVLLPISIIALIDIVHPYWILYRQFAWVAIPTYVILAQVANSSVWRVKMK